MDIPNLAMGAALIVAVILALTPPSVESVPIEQSRNAAQSVAQRDARSIRVASPPKAQKRLLASPKFDDAPLEAFDSSKSGVAPLVVETPHMPFAPKLNKKSAKAQTAPVITKTAP